jgi:hypothetical protein
MNKLYKSILVFGFLILSITGAYYTAFYLPKINERNFVLSQQQKCLEVGQAAYKADGQEYGGVANLDDPQYGYSKKLNTCIYSSGYSYQGDPSSGVSNDILKHNCNAYWEKWVKNSYTNEKILEVFNSNYQCEWTAKPEVIKKFDTDSEVLFSS